ncbi:amino acid permease [Paenibacillus eucommiae]|uniref:L-asparagine transporter-like permease n=1 Tax=Paenibacillus eucommiae TaxID=1355755 RepID=A0ABS4J0L3_9BACL|nr:amino acid permease [Paenibacillus eucommiae]MBP1993379.1 L-asparagine transporter-like permease [Paenibacillus eucommiae]
MPKRRGHLQWWHLSLLGMGCTIGNGFFLGTNIAIQKSAYSVLVLLVLAALATYVVFDALARMTAEQPEKGSFRTYAKQAYGRWAGFSSGWIYWSSEMLISGSSLMALSIFTQFWFPQVALWILTAIYAGLGLIVLILGAKGLEQTENFLAVMKVSAIVLFIFLALSIWLGWIDLHAAITGPSIKLFTFFSPDFKGMWMGFIYAFYAFAGIEVMGLMAAGLREPKNVKKSGRVMIISVACLYVASIGLLLVLVPLERLQQEGSPFILGLTSLGLHVLVHIFNGVLILAGFSTLVASLYGVTVMLTALAEDGDAPPSFAAKKGQRKLPYPVLGLTVLGLIASIMLALWVPEHIFEHIATAAGLVLLYTWSFILISVHRVIKLSIWGWIKGAAALALMAAAVSGTWMEAASRPGFWVSLLLVVMVAVVTFFMSLKWKKQEIQ